MNLKMYMVDDGEIYWIGAESEEHAIRIYKEWDEYYQDHEEAIEVTELLPDKKILFKEHDAEEWFSAQDLLDRYGEGIICSTAFD